MSFTSALFLPFIVIFYCLWYFLKNPKERFLLLSISSLLFYGAWNPLYVPLLILSSYIAFFASQKIYEQPKNARLWLIGGVGCDLAILFFFKYADFLIQSFNDFFTLFGAASNLPLLQIALPVGISFYTFQSISHTVDVYRKELKPTKNFSSFLLFESLFPHLVAGPIQKAKFLIPQVEKFERGELPNKREKIKEGLDLILVGYVKKMLIADNLAIFVNSVFNHIENAQFYSILIAILFFTVQIYCDFSGYTDIARGLAKTLGFEFSLNFNFPYFSRNISDFWNRWHISLSSWLRDYLYIPLGGNKYGSFNTYRNLLITMVLGGLWHGASYTFLIWGFYQGLLLILNKLIAQYLRAREIKIPDVLSWALTILCVMFGWYIFRANTANDLLYLFKSATNINLGNRLRPDSTQWFLCFTFILFHLYYRFSARLTMLKVFHLRAPVRLIVTVILIFLCIIWSPESEQEFIYFQF